MTKQIGGLSSASYHLNEIKSENKIIYFSRHRIAAMLWSKVGILMELSTNTSVLVRPHENLWRTISCACKRLLLNLPTTGRCISYSQLMARPLLCGSFWEKWFPYQIDNKYACVSRKRGYYLNSLLFVIARLPIAAPRPMAGLFADISEAEMHIDLS